MGQAFDRNGNVLGEAFGETKREVFDKLMAQHADAHEVRIRMLADREAKESAPFDTTGGASVEMPRYKCHKDVWALKISAVVDPTQPGNESDGSRILSFAEPGYASLRVPHDYVRKHNPQPGGYYVVYKDGYQSFSPADAFEDGYTRI